MEWAIDIGGTKVALCQPSGSSSQHFYFNSSASLESDIVIVNQCLHAISAHCAEVSCVAIASAPNISANGIVQQWPNRPHWQGFDLIAHVKNQLDCDVFVMDDGCAAALAEHQILDTPDSLHFTIGTGVGGGIFAARNLIKPAELGHFVVNNNGPQCSCGRYGCLQAYFSGRAFKSYLNAQHISSSNFEDAKTVAPELIDDWYKKGVFALSQVVISLSEVFQPEVVTIGGGFASSIEHLVADVVLLCSRLCRSGKMPPKIALSAFPQNPSLQGAKTLLLDISTRKYALKF
ncbi:MAG: ROK family protein [Aestuariibacter sp.]